MPTTREEHIVYTKNELNNSQYYIDVLGILKNDSISSFMDIGANVGEFSNIIKSKIPTLTKGYLFEPEINNFNFMKNNIKYNFECYNFAIGYGFKNPILNHSTNVGGFYVTESDDENKSIVIKTLEELNLPLVDLIKMDVEGCEFNIIENSKYLKSVKWLEVEFHQTPKQVSEGFIPNYIKENLPNYEIMVFDGDPNNLYGRCLLKKVI